MKYCMKSGDFHIANIIILGTCMPWHAGPVLHMPDEKWVERTTAWLPLNAKTNPSRPSQRCNEIEYNWPNIPNDSCMEKGGGLCPALG